MSDAFRQWARDYARAKRGVNAFIWNLRGKARTFQHYWALKRKAERRMLVLIQRSPQKTAQLLLKVVIPNSNANPFRNQFAHQEAIRKVLDRSS